MGWGAPAPALTSVPAHAPVLVTAPALFLSLCPYSISGPVPGPAPVLAPAPAPPSALTSAHTSAPDPPPVFAPASAPAPTLIFFFHAGRCRCR